MSCTSGEIARLRKWHENQPEAKLPGSHTPYGNGYCGAAWGEDLPEGLGPGAKILNIGTIDDCWLVIEYQPADSCPAKRVVFFSDDRGMCIEYECELGVKFDKRHARKWAT